MGLGLYLLIPLSVVLVFIIGVIFWWSVRSGQFDDMEGPAYRMLYDDRDREERPGKGGRPGATTTEGEAARDVSEEQGATVKPGSDGEERPGKRSPHDGDLPN